MKMKRNLPLRGIVLALALTVALSVTALAANLPFTDVPAGAWYEQDVKFAYDSGLVNGKSATTFAPNSNMTYAEAVKLAACMNQKYNTGSVTLTNGSPNWYDSYVNYCKVNGIISKDYSWSSPATRAGYMEIFANCLPSAALAPMNSVQTGSIPDVSASHPQADAIYKLYRAGILQGVDDTGACSPNNPIKRSEVSAILTRMMDSSTRKSFSLGEKEYPPTVTTIGSLGKTTEEGTPVTMSVSASSEQGTLTYQWQKGSGSSFYNVYDSSAGISGSTSSTLTYTPSLSDNGASFRCVVTNNTAGKTYTANSGTFTLTVTEKVVPIKEVTPQTEPSVSVKDIPWKAAGVDGSGNPIVLDTTVKQYTYTFSTVPTCYDEIIQYKLDTPYKTMALAFLAFRAWTPDNPTDCYEMMNYLTNTAARKADGTVYQFSEYNFWTQFMKDRMMQNTKYRFIGNAYLGGATPSNNYTPSTPVTVTLRESTYVPYKAAEGNSPELYQVLISIPGADSERYSLLYKDSRNGDWKFFSDNWKGLLADVKTPAIDSLY